LFYIDEVLVNRFSFLNISVSEIERIEVLKGPSTAILGSRGANGALLIYTRRAEHQRQFSYEYQLKGYHTTREFFGSQIDVQRYQLNQVPRTILWAPEIVPDINGRVRVRIPYGENHELLRFRLEGIDSEGQVIFLQF
jgi:TonB-dependent SusC/RagA subfamily outer membrane receptor